MSEQIKRFKILAGDPHIVASVVDGSWVAYSDHLADKEASRAEDRAEIASLRAQLALCDISINARDAFLDEIRGALKGIRNETIVGAIQQLRQRAEKAEARIAELESSQKVKQADSLVNDDEAVRRDAARYRWLRLRLCAEEINSAKAALLGIEIAGPILRRNPDPDYTGEMDIVIDTAIAAAKAGAEPACSCECHRPGVVMFELVPCCDRCGQSFKEK